MAGQGRRRGGQAVERRARYEPTEGCLVPIGLCNLWATVCQRNVCFLDARRVCVISQCGRSFAGPYRGPIGTIFYFGDYYSKRNRAGLADATRATTSHARVRS